MQDVAAKRGINCLMDSDVVGAVNMQKVIQPELHKIAVAAKCSDSNVRSFMSETEVIQFVYNNYGIKVVIFVLLQNCFIDTVLGFWRNQKTTVRFWSFNF